MTTELTLQIPAITWTPRLSKKPTVQAALRPQALEKMTLNELLFHALAQ